ncbi:4Fe-4S binding protein, partial [Chloroflexota bacterium]
MPIEKIDIYKCNGCKVCVEACPMDVIRFDESKDVAYI